MSPISADAVPVLPGGFTWVTSAAEATRLVRTGTIPIVLPDDRERAARWAQVLHTYGAVPTLEPAGSGSKRLVVSVGDTGEVGRTAAVGLGRIHRDVPDLRTVSLVDVPADASVLLVAPAAVCTFANLQPILQRWHRDRILSGVLTGLDIAGMSFSLAKILADRHGSAPKPDSDVYLYGTTGAALTSTEESPALADALASPWRHVVVDAHGTGSHAMMGSYILCGLSGDRERALDGSPVAGGCTHGDCGAGRSVLDQVLVRNIRCRTLALFVCNGITLNPDEQFPSDVALAHAALEGYPSTIMGLFRQDADTTTVEPMVAARLFASGASASTVTSWLAQDAAGRGCPSAYLLLGDPELTDPDASVASAVVRWPEGTQPVLPAIVDHANQPVSAVLTDQGVLSPPEAVEPLRIWDADPQVTATVEDLAQWLAGCAEAEHLEDSLEALMGPSSKRRTVLSQCLDQMRAYRVMLKRQVLDGVWAAQEYRRHRRRGPSAEPPLVELRSCALGWAAALNDSVTARAGAFRLWEALEATHTARPATSDTACRRCHSPLTRTDLASPVSGLGDRVSITCPRCGPSAHVPALRPVTARGPATLRRGDVAEVNVTIPAVPGQVQDVGLLAVQLQDRAGLTALTQQLCTARPGEEHTLSLPVPPELGNDLHRIWVLWVHRFQVSVLQLRVPTDPCRSPDVATRTTS